MDENRQPVILDCDPGIDDAVALLLAARAPELKLVAVTAVAGNVGLDKTSLNARRVLTLAGVAVPVFAGASGPMFGEQVTADGTRRRRPAGHPGAGARVSPGRGDCVGCDLAEGPGIWERAGDRGHGTADQPGHRSG